MTDLDLPEPKLADGVNVRTFSARPGRRGLARLALNAEAFAHHPEQGSLTQRDLDDRKAEVWFDPSGFFLAFRGDELVGFHWTKVHAEEGLGEVYVLGVRPVPRAAASARPSPRSGSATSPGRACRPPCSTSTPTTRRP